MEWSGVEWGRVVGMSGQDMVECLEWGIMKCGGVEWNGVELSGML